MAKTPLKYGSLARLVKITSDVDAAFAQLELREEEVTLTTVREELKRILNEEKSTRLTVGQTYQLLTDETKENACNGRKVRSQNIRRCKTICQSLTMYFEDISDELLVTFELFLESKREKMDLLNKSQSHGAENSL